jgi:hypothetical protein
MGCRLESFLVVALPAFVGLDLHKKALATGQQGNQVGNAVHQSHSLESGHAGKTSLCPCMSHDFIRATEYQYSSPAQILNNARLNIGFGHNGSPA